MEEILNRLKRIEGQVRGLQKMVLSGEDCDKFLTQLSAAKGALESVGMSVIASNMKKCIGIPLGNGEELRAEQVNEAMDMVIRHLESLKS